VGGFPYFDHYPAGLHLHDVDHRLSGHGASGTPLKFFDFVDTGVNK
jgi:hypothetical protein